MALVATASVEPIVSPTAASAILIETLVNWAMLGQALWPQFVLVSVNIATCVDHLRVVDGYELIAGMIL